MVDTGSATTILHAVDATKIGVPIFRLAGLETARGISGARQYYAGRSTVGLGSSESTQTFEITIGIAPPENTRITSDLPSLPCREVLNQF